MSFNFQAQFDSISRWTGNQRLLTQYLETEVFGMLFANPKSAMRARALVENLSWAIRMDKIASLAQLLLDTTNRHGTNPVPYPEYSQVRTLISE